MSDVEHPEVSRRPVRFSASALALSRLAATLSAVVTFPLAVGSLGEARFGVWATLSSLLLLLSVLDFGVGNAMVTDLAAARADRDHGRVTGMVRSGYGVVSSIGVVLLLAGAGLVVSGQAQSFLGAVGSAPSADLTAAFLVALVTLVVIVVCGLGDRILLGLERAHLAAGCVVAGACVQLAAVTGAAAVDASLPVFVLAFASGALVANGSATIVALVATRRCAGSLRATSTPRLGRELARRGSWFFGLAVAAAVGYQTDAIVIARELGPADVAEYAVVARIVLSLVGVMSVAFQPLWAAYASALASNDRDWIRTRFRLSLGVAVLASTTCAVLLVLATPTVVDVWLGGTIEVSASLLHAFALYLVVMTISAPFAMLLNGVGIIRVQLAFAVVMAVANVGLSVVLARSVGVAGPVLATGITQVVCILLPMSVYLARSKEFAWVMRREQVGPGTQVATLAETLS